MRRVVLAVGILLLAVLTYVRGLDPRPVRELRETYFDYLQILRPRPYTPLPVRVVDVDEQSLAEIGQWPWPRETFAELVDKLTQYGAAVVVFDVIFAESDRLSPSSLVDRFQTFEAGLDPAQRQVLALLDTDQMFADSIARSNVVLGVAVARESTTEQERAKAGFVQIGDAPGALAPTLTAATPILPVLRAAAAGVGSISVNPLDSSTQVREVPLVWNSPAGFYPSLSLEALRLALGGNTFVLQGTAGVQGYLETISFGGLTIPVQPDGQFWVHYRHETPELYVSAREVLRQGFDPALGERLAGNIVFIGTSAAGLVDIRTTALRQNVPGVSIHAQIIEQILLGDFLLRNDVVSAAEIAAFILTGLIVLGVMSRSGPMASISSGLLTGVIVLSASWTAYVRYQILFDATFPLVGGFLAFSGLAAYQFIVADRDKRMMRKTFSHYVSPGILDQIERSGHQAGLGGVNREVSLMFCDIRNFTPLSEGIKADAMVSLLNNLFTKLGSQILNKNGTIDKFIGDAIMAFWNAPIETPNHRELAALAAIEMRHALLAFNAETDHPPVAVAIGINTGIACVGNIGSRDRFNYSAIGDTVNVAARIEAACRQVEYDILLTDTMAQGVAEMAILPSGSLVLKGKSSRLATYILVGDRTVAQTDDFARLAEMHGRLVSGFASTGNIDEDLRKACRDLGCTIEPGLGVFYDRITLRAADFTAPQAEGQQTGEGAHTHA